MSQNKLKEMNMNGDSGSTSTATTNGNGCIKPATNGNVTGASSSDLKARKAALTPLEYRVTQQRETERPFSNKYNKFWESGTYHCIVCDAELFKSETKFESKSGWPAFYNVVDPQRVKLTPDVSHVGANLLLLIAKPDLARTEVSCASCNAHLGHLFKDGPKPTGLRYCINSSSLNFRSSSDPEGSNGFPNVNGYSSSFLTNGNGTSNSSAPREFICNPDNLCSKSNRQAFTPSPPPTLNSRLPGFNPPQQPHSLACTPTGAKEFVSKNSSASARENFFSSFDNSMPPMGALCLNNQSCQRRPPTQPKTTSEEVAKKSIISNGAENDVITNGNGLKSSTLKVNLKPPLQTKTSNNANARNSTGSSTVVPPPTTSKTNLNLNTNAGTTTTTTPVTSVTTATKQRFPFSKGVSLTAARINFFQKIASSKDSPSPPSRWATTFNARWSSSTRSPSSSSSNNTHHEQENMTINNFNNDNVSSSSSGRFPSSCSSGSLCTVTKQPRPDDLTGPKRSTSSFFARTSISQTPTIEQISIAPKTVALRETTL